MSKKTEVAYTALFRTILTLEPGWQPQTIIVDFEEAAIASIKIVFPRTDIRGCWNHSSQAIWEKMGNLGKFISYCHA